MTQSQQSMSWRILAGDCLERLKELPDASVDSLVTDPPAGIGFMGKAWDSDKGGRGAWVAWMTEVMAECKRVLKPGAHGLVWALPRTSHWTATALEDAGFEVRDCVYHLFGQGFPKSLDISKAIDKQAGAKREIVGSKLGQPGYSLAPEKPGKNRAYNSAVDGSMTNPERECEITAPSTDAAKKWAGWGTALKPAVECWWLVRKPISEKNVAANVLKHGTGGVNIDGCRIEGPKRSPEFKAPESKGQFGQSNNSNLVNWDASQGRFPANLVLSHHPDCKPLRCNRALDSGACCSPTGTCATEAPCDPKMDCVADCAVKMLDEQAGELGERGNAGPSVGRSERGFIRSETPSGAEDNYGGGSASRFFYVGKITPGERGEGNKHPTVKPAELMVYLCKLITPPGGTILDPFTGSGSTGIAATKLGCSFIGIEREPEYVAVARERIIGDAPLLNTHTEVSQ